MDDIKQERPNEDPILNLNKRLYGPSLTKTFGTDLEKSAAFKTLKK